MSKVSKKMNRKKTRKSGKLALAKTKNLRVSPQKLRLVADQIRGKKTEQAFSILKASTKKSASLIENTLNSAVSNAENNFELDTYELFVGTICVDEAPVLKRFKCRARGRGDRILKRSSHLTIIVEERGVDFNG